MQKSKIEWTDYTLNPVKGLCPMACSYCYARRMYKRFKWNPEIRFDWSVVNDLGKMETGSRIFWGSTMELFGDWVDPEWMRLIFEAVKRHPNLTHIFLTKQPQNLIKWSPFPDNCWVGVSWIGDDNSRPLRYIETIKSRVKFISFEPLLQFGNWWTADLLRQSFQKAGIQWVIIGQQTPVRKDTMPKIEWVQEITEACDRAGIPVFLKDNLKFIFQVPNKPYAYTYPGWAHYKGKLRQEFPITGGN